MLAVCLIYISSLFSFPSRSLAHVYLNTPVDVDRVYRTSRESQMRLVTVTITPLITPCVMVTRACSCRSRRTIVYGCNDNVHQSCISYDDYADTDDGYDDSHNNHSNSNNSNSNSNTSNNINGVRLCP